MIVEEMKEVIDVESYEIDTQSIIHDRWFFIAMGFLDWMHSPILLGIAFSIHSRFYCISGIHRPSCAMD